MRKLNREPLSFERAAEKYFFLCVPLCLLRGTLCNQKKLQKEPQRFKRESHREVFFFSVFLFLQFKIIFFFGM